MEPLWYSLVSRGVDVFGVVPVLAPGGVEPAGDPGQLAVVVGDRDGDPVAEPVDHVPGPGVAGGLDV